MTSKAFVERVRRLQRKRRTIHCGRTSRRKPQELLTRIEKYALGGQSNTAAAPTPACKQQSKLESIYGNGEKTQYQHTYEQTGR